MSRDKHGRKARREEQNRAYQQRLRERKRLRAQRRAEQTKANIKAATAVLNDAAECWAAAKRRRRSVEKTHEIYVTLMHEKGHNKATAERALEVGRAHG